MEKEITVIMTRVYQTSFTVKANNEKEAIEKVKALEDKYAVELEQFCVTNEKFEAI